jgi:hypothetical protein
VLKRLLASLAITSVILLCVLCVYWWRSYHGHVDSFTLGKLSPTESHFFSQNGRIWLQVTDRTAGAVTDRLQSYRFRDVLGYFLILPCLWIAIIVRGYLPRPPGREPSRTIKRKA